MAIGNPLQQSYLITGAGVLILHEKNRKYYVILAKNKFKNIYEDLGGSLDPNETPEMCAAREVLEESRGVIRINPHDLSFCPYIDIIRPGSTNAYRCFIYRLNDPNFSCKIFYMTNPLYLPQAYRETTKLSRFPLEKLRKIFYKYNGYPTEIPRMSVRGKLYENIAYSRVRSILHEGFIRRIL
jgi:hypothetical protein